MIKKVLIFIILIVIFYDIYLLTNRKIDNTKNMEIINKNNIPIKNNIKLENTSFSFIDNTSTNFNESTSAIIDNKIVQDETNDDAFDENPINELVKSLQFPFLLVSQNIYFLAIALINEEHVFLYQNLHKDCSNQIVPPPPQG